MANILAVEDESDIREMLREELQEHGYTVSAAANGREALQKLASFTPDLVLSDISMPEMDGFQLLQSIRDNHPDLADVPFVFLTALSSRENKISGREAGADDYVTKPIDLDDLLSTLSSRLLQVARMRERKEQQFVKLFTALTEKHVSDQTHAETERSAPADGNLLAVDEPAEEDKPCLEPAEDKVESETVYGAVFDFPKLTRQKNKLGEEEQGFLERLRAKSVEILTSLVFDEEFVSETPDGAVMVSYRDSNKEKAQRRSRQLADDLQKEVSTKHLDALIAETSLSPEMVANALVVSEALFEVEIPPESVTNHASFEYEIQKVVCETRDNKRAPTLLVNSIKNSGGHLTPLKIVARDNQELPICFFNYDESSRRKMRAAFAFFGDKNKEKASYLVDVLKVELVEECAKHTDVHDTIVIDVHFDTLISETYGASYAHKFLRFAENTRRALIVNVRSIPPDTPSAHIDYALGPLGKHASRRAVQVDPLFIEDFANSELPVACIVCSFPELARRPAILGDLARIKPALEKNKTLLVLRGIGEQESREKFHQAGFDGYAVEPASAD